MSEEENDEENEGSKARPCRLCNKPCTVLHLYRAHPIQWRDYLASKIGFGMCISSVVDARCAYKVGLR